MQLDTSSSIQLIKKEITIMQQKLSNGAKIVDSWAQIVDETAAGYPADTFIEGLARAQHRRREDPWVTLIDRLWDANPLRDRKSVV